MSVHALEYHLQNGFIHNWLVAGPLLRPVTVSGSPVDEIDRKKQIIRELEDNTLGYTEMPVDRTGFDYAGETLVWRYFRCSEDHLVDLSTVVPVWQHARSWANTRLVLSRPAALTFSLSVSSPARVWLNGNEVFRVDDFQGELSPVVFRVDALAENDLLVRFEQLCAGQCAMQLALQVVDLGGLTEEEVKIQVPTKAIYPNRHQQFERLFECAYLEGVTNYRGQVVNLCWADDTGEEMRFAYQIQDAEERIYVEGTADPESGAPVDVGHPQRIFERPMWVVLRATGREYFEQDMRYERRIPLYIMDNDYSDAPYGDIATRRIEALEDAARRENNLFAEIAKMALDKWDKLDASVIQASIDSANRCEAGSISQVAGLLSILYRFAETPRFPADRKEPIEACLLAYPYWVDEGAGSGMDFISESQAVMFHTCEILAGQRFPDRVFGRSGQTGRDHQAKGEQLALDWLRQRGQGGFIEWNANNTFETNIMALSLLTSLAESDPVRELSAVLLDKIIFLMAVNSYKGVYGATHGKTTAGMVRSARLEATSGIARFLWGMGVFSQYIQGTVSLACSTYEYPAFFADIAAQLPEEMLSKERQVASLDNGAVEVNTVTYKTPDYMLSSAQDYRPGQKGNHEHIWQATMGPDAIVFANHPACMRDDEAHAPGFWLGNAALPRVAQWKDVLIAVHHLPADDRMGFTHAYFPIAAFDEFEIEKGWAFARKGKGYLAITAQQGIELVKRGPDGYRELRSAGKENIWLCHMGRDDQDGYFKSFRREILKSKPVWKKSSVRFTSLRGDELAFGWQGPLQVNGQEQPITGFPHIENPYCTAGLPAEQMDIQFGEILMRLNFS